MSCKRCEVAARTRPEPPRERTRRGCTSAAPPRYGVDFADARAGGTVQRKCDSGCGGHAAAPRATEPGKALDHRTRRFFEARMGGQDFSGVRIHDGSGAAAAARGMSARAFTVGQDISFGAGQFRPGDVAGQRLLAHELAHVVQQRGGAGTVQMASGAPGDAHEREADAVADRIAAGGAARPTLHAPPSVQRDALPGSLLDDKYKLKVPTLPPPPLFRPGSIREAWVIPEIPAPPKLEMPEPVVPFWRRNKPVVPPLTLDPALRFTPVKIIPVPRYVPDRPLTWADFPGNNVPGGFGAVTRMAAPQLLTIDGNPMFQAQLNTKNPSAVGARSRNAGVRASNGCAPLVARCQRDMRASPGGTWTTSRPVPDTCPASIVSIDTANTVGECETVIGAGCDAAAVAESNRLLAHEQAHFDLLCKLVGRANDALIAGTHTTAVLAKWLQDNLQPQQDSYDDPTSGSNHGCDAAQQAAWVAKIAAGLPAVPLPAPTTAPTP
ncbi:MAG: DUF4157 domain-containing protein [Novosphingobium sp.]